MECLRDSRSAAARSSSTRSSTRPSIGVFPGDSPIHLGNREASAPVAVSPVSAAAFLRHLRRRRPDPLDRSHRSSLSRRRPAGANPHPNRRRHQNARGESRPREPPPPVPAPWSHEARRVRQGQSPDRSQPTSFHAPSLMTALYRIVMGPAEISHVDLRALPAPGCRRIPGRTISERRRGPPEARRAEAPTRTRCARRWARGAPGSAQG